MPDDLIGVLDPDPSVVAPAPAPVAALVAVQAPDAALTPAEEPAEEPDEEKYVPLGALTALRAELRALKPAAQRAEQLEAELQAARPYVDFLRAHPHLVTPAAPPAPAPAQDPAADPALVSLARTLDLYDAQGQPDVQRAQTIREMTRTEAHAVARAEMAPVAERAHEQQAAANLSQIMTTVTDAQGQPLDEQYLTAAVRSITGQVSRAEAVRMLADPQVAQLLSLTALGMQARHRRPGATLPAPGPVLAVETPGGVAPVTMTEDSRRLMKSAGVSEQDYLARAAQYVPNRQNSLE